jgi:hypothetical protein
MYDSDVRVNQNLPEYGKFVEIKGDSRFPAVSVTRFNSPNVAGMAPVSSVDTYSKYAVLTHLVNASDITLTLSASNVDIGNVGIVDHTTGTDVYAQIVRTATVGGSEVGAVRVITTGITPISGTITVSNPITAVTVLNTVSSFSLVNPVTAVTINNPVSSFSLVNPVTAVTITNPVTAISVTPLINYSGNYNLASDAFGRTRISSPLTLFDSSHRYADNNLWSTLTGGTTTTSASAQFNQNQGLVELKVDALSGSKVYRETTKVFAYQPGKSLQIMSTFTFSPSTTNLRQRVGYYGAENGIYLELDDSSLYMVERSLVTGTVTSTRTPQSGWNVDKLDGSGPSGITLDITKAQILFMDIEWLGLGTVRTGFVINGQFVPCHYFHHANLIDSTYITTASLPLRYEIENKAATSGPSKLKQVCSTVISEGGYELRGLQQAASIPITAPRTFAVAGTFYPIISIRLKTTPDRLDAIIILTALSILGDGNGINYNWQVRASGVTTGGSWVDAGVDSAVQYNITGTSYAGGRILASGFLNSSNQGSPNLDILKEALFKFQLERNNLTKTPFELTLVAASDTTNGSGMFASMDWEEVSR